MAGQYYTQSQSIVQEIRERTDIVAVIGRFVPLKRAGASYKGCCPFHQEKTPSFFVHPDKQFFYCFGCGAKGDVFSFLMDYEGKRFPEVMRDLAEEYGIALPSAPLVADLNPEEDQKKEKLYQLNHWAKQFYQEALQSPAGQEVRSYLEQRGVSAEMVEAFGIGYAHDDWGKLTDLVRDRAGDQELELACEVGLLKQSEESGRIYDRYRHRLMFPITLPSGRISGFGGRVLRDSDGAKYLNSPESPIFQKSQLLYGLDLAAQDIRKQKHAILVEGYLDVIAMHQYGFVNAVATLGTSLNEEHVPLLKRYTKRVVLLFDGDKAGIRAAERALQILMPGGIAVDVLILPEGEDPDTLLRSEGRTTLESLFETQVQAGFDFWLSHLQAQAGDDPLQLRAASQKVLELLQKLDDPILRDLYVKRTAERLGIDEVQVRRGLMRVVPRPSATSRSAAPATTEETTAPIIYDDITLSEQETLAHMIKIVLENPDLFSFVAQAEMSHRLQVPLLREVWAQLISDLQEGGGHSAVMEGVLDSLNPLPLFQRTLAQSLMQEPPFEEETLELQWNDLVNKLEYLQIERKLNHLRQAIREAAQAGETSQLESLAREKQKYQKQRLEWRSKFGPSESIGA